MPLQDLTVPPPAPQRDDDPETFIERADAFVAWFDTFVGQMNTLSGQLEATAALIAVAPAYADPGLLALTGLTPAADRLPYFNGGATSALATFTAAARTLLDDASVDAMLTTLGLTANGKSLVTAADYAEMRTLLSLYTAAQTDAAIAASAVSVLALAAPSGAVMAFAMDTPPAGWLDCNGAAVSRATYADLFAAIGTVHGAGDGSTTFNLPDLRGEFVRGWDDGRGVDAARAFGSAQADELEAHTHTVRFNLRNIDGSDNEGDGTLDTGSGLASGYIGSTGGTETRPRNIAMLYAIKT